MPGLQSALPIAIPLMLAALAFAWSVTPEGHRARILSRAVWALPAAVALLAVGEVVNGLWKAPGFHGPSFVLGLALTAGLLLLVRFRDRPVLRRIAGRAAAAVREDFADDRPRSALPRPVLVLLLLGGGLLWGVVALAAGLLDNWLLFLNHRYLFLLTEASRLGTPWERMLLHVCADPLTATPFGFALAPFAQRLDAVIPILLLRVGVGLALLVAAVTTRLRELGWRAVAGLCLLVLMAPDSRYSFNSSAVFELVFAGLFLANLLMVLRLRRRPGYLLVLGVVTGFTLVHKETNLLNVVLAAWVLGRERTTPRDAGRLVGAWLAGLLLGMAPLILEQVRCGATEGMALLPYLGFRGRQLATELTQPIVQTLPAEVLARDLVDIVLARLSFQTVGEVAIGAVAALAPAVLTGAFPALFLMVNGPRERAARLGVLLALCVPLYGLIWWKGGDSAEALQVLLPFGFVYAVPYLARLGRTWAATWRNGKWRTPRALYLHLLVGFNLVWMAGMVPPLARAVSALPDEVRWLGTRTETVPGQDSALHGIVADLQERGALSSVLVCEGCWTQRTIPLLRLADAGVFVVDLDVRYQLADRLFLGETRVLAEVLHLLPHRQTMDMRLAGRRPDPPTRELEHLLIAGIPDHLRAFLNNPPPALAECIDVLDARPGHDGWVLLRLHRRACLDLASPMDAGSPVQ